MTSREEFSAFARSDRPQQQSNNGGGNGTTSDWIESWARRGQGGGCPLQSRPPQARKYGEQTPLLMPPITTMPQSVPPKSPNSFKQRGRGHARSSSDYVRVPKPPGNSLAPINRSKPPRASHPPSQPQPVVSRGVSGHRKVISHRRVKSDIPLAIFGGCRKRDVITKADLLKNFPNPRWGGPRTSPLNHSRQRSRTGSDGLHFDGNGSVSSVPSIYGAISSDTDGGANSKPAHQVLQSIGSIGIAADAKRHGHVHHMSDASARSVTTDIAKSALFKTVTKTGRIQMQLPKDSFRILMDSALEAGRVYKRQLVDSEDEFFLEFYTEDNDHLSDERPALIPDLYVMAVDSTLYRRMLDEVIQSRSMPFGTFFCGHHEDVDSPGIGIAVVAVLALFAVMLLVASRVGG